MKTNPKKGKLNFKMGDPLDRSSMDQDELTKMSSKQKAVFTRKLGELEDKIENKV